jgi:hypothetical protein
MRGGYQPSGPYLLKVPVRIECRAQLKSPEMLVVSSQFLQVHVFRMTLVKYGKPAAFHAGKNMTFSRISSAISTVSTPVVASSIYRGLKETVNGDYHYNHVIFQKTGVTLNQSGGVFFEDSVDIKRRW